MTPPSLLQGMTTAQLQQALVDAQAALVQLQMGSKGESFAYAQGDGSKSVTYTRTSLPQLTMLIRQLQQALGMIPQARRPIRVRF
ncbi:gpW family head-tail joining protein [Aquitalea magnusonii]|uniref:GpW protein n=2 Tax=Aquitalea magnusonii TaxID=332411 RepID=A0A318JHT3_9NEIS|nr:gpW family head-tail joining protein [Aquitalea magnusonii]PXX49383.1 gpW protein [Aquitalea magnusonii]